MTGTTVGIDDGLKKFCGAGLASEPAKTSQQASQPARLFAAHGWLKGEFGSCRKKGWAVGVVYFPEIQDDVIIQFLVLT